MKKLSNATLAARDALVTRLRAHYAALDTAVDAFNVQMDEKWESVVEAQDAYNDAVSDAKEWLEQHATDMEEYRDERSDRWRDSAPGLAYQAWIDAFRGVELEESELEIPRGLDMPGEQIDDLEGLPDTPDA